jgi:hypothetical protein
MLFGFKIEVKFSESDLDIDVLNKYLFLKLWMDSNAARVMDACKVQSNSIKWLNPFNPLGKGFAKKCYNRSIATNFKKETLLTTKVSHPNIMPFICYAMDMIKVICLL